MTLPTLVRRRWLAVMVAAATLLSVAVVPASTALAAESSAATYKPIVIGMGDSVAAGYGAGQIAGSPYATPCERTVKAYPTLLQYPPYLQSYNLACAGATGAQGLNGAQTRNGVTVPSQVSQLNALPNRPLLVTLTVGANDVQWTNFLGLCLIPNAPTDPGCDTQANTDTFTFLLNSSLPQIQQAINSIKARQPLRIALTGYYDPFGSTAVAYGFTPTEITWYRARVAQLNTALQQLAASNNIKFVDNMNLDAAGGDVILGANPLATYGFAHPTAVGQQKIAKNVLKALL